MDQIEQITNLLKILGKYMFLDREQLDHFSKKTYGNTIGLSYLQRSIKHNLIAEIQSEENVEKYYFQLKSGGICFLESTPFKFRAMPLYYGRKERQKILQVNNYLIMNDYLLSPEHLFENVVPIITTDNTVLLLSEKESDIVQYLKELYFKEEDSDQEVYNIFRFERMQLEHVTFSGKAKGNANSKLTF